MNRGLWVIGLTMLLGGANCARETVSCPEGTAIVDFEDGGRECVPIGPDGGLGGTGGMGGAGGMGNPECEDDLDCPFEEESRCNLTSQTCEPCLEDLDCAGIDGLPRCDVAEGLCVECLPATEAMDCGDRSCDPATRTCSDIVRGSRAECEVCVSDSDCIEDFACVPMQFGNVPLRGGFCLQTNGSGECAQPFAFPLPDPRESLSGAAAAVYCGVNEELTSCEAVLALVQNVPCDDDFDCVAPGGICRQVGDVGLRCTYECSGATQCIDPDVVIGSTCGDADGTAEENYCGG
jgi:hypothetical protein